MFNITEILIQKKTNWLGHCLPFIEQHLGNAPYMLSKNNKHLVVALPIVHKIQSDACQKRKKKERGHVVCCDMSPFQKQPFDSKHKTHLLLHQPDSDARQLLHFRAKPAKTWFPKLHVSPYN